MIATHARDWRPGTQHRWQNSVGHGGVQTSRYKHLLRLLHLIVCLFIWRWCTEVTWSDVLCAAHAIDPRPLPARVWTPAEPYQDLMTSIFHRDLAAIKPPCCVCSHVCVMMCGLTRLRHGPPRPGSIPAVCIGESCALFFAGWHVVPWPSTGFEAAATVIYSGLSEASLATHYEPSPPSQSSAGGDASPRAPH